MSLSSLPGIFREQNFVTLTPRKQGGSFSLYLSSPMPEYHSSSRSSSSSKGRKFATLDVNKRRSISSSILKQRQAALSDENSTKNVLQRSKNQVTFNDQINLWGNTSAKRGRNFAVINISNVFYETNRKFNNRMLDLQEADSLKNTTELSLKQIGIIQLQFEQVKQSTKQIQLDFRPFVQEKVEDLANFQDQFTKSLKTCYSSLSKLRRETNEQVRTNKKRMQKVANQISVCSAVLNDLSQKGQQIASQTIKVPREFVQSAGRESIPFDLQEISEIPKTSRGGTGSISKRTKLYELLNKNDQQRKSAQWDLGLEMGNLEIN